MLILYLVDIALLMIGVSIFNMRPVYLTHFSCFADYI